MVAKQPSVWKMHIFSHIFPNYTITEHTWKPASTEKDGFPCISPPFPHMQSFQSNDLQWTYKETSAFKHTTTTESERRRQMTPAQQTRLVGRSWHSSPRGRPPYACSNIITNTLDTWSYCNTNSLCAPTGTFYCSDVALSCSQQIVMTS